MVRNCTSTSGLLIRLEYVGSGRTLFIAEPEVQFYTHPHGYKKFLRVNANGHGDGEGSHISVFVHLMRGEFDDHLKWPFRGDITIQLLNQLEDKKQQHHTETIHFNDKTPDSVASRDHWRER